MRETGMYQIIGSLHYFIPHPLPPQNPSLSLDASIMTLYGQANFALGQLNQVGQLPNPFRFIKAYILKEALLSSDIEGIHTTLIDVLTHTTQGSKPDKNTQLVINYTECLETALQMLQQGLPLSSRVILAAHKTLLQPNSEATPGLYRKQSVRVGNLVPPPAPEVPALMNALEEYINKLHTPADLPPLIKAGLVHAQFETIHPFIDGNGRIGRLLIVLMLIESGLLMAPVLYPSYYFKKNHFDYYHKLDRVRTHGDFEGWITYYLTAIRDSALDAYTRSKDIITLEHTLKESIQTDAQFSKMRGNTAIILDFLFSQPITTIPHIAKETGKAYNTCYNIIKQFIALKMVSEHINESRTKLYRFEPYLALLEKEYS